MRLVLSLKKGHKIQQIQIRQTNISIIPTVLVHRTIKSRLCWKTLAMVSACPMVQNILSPQVNCSEGCNDGWLVVRCATRNFQGIASQQEICLNYGSNFVTACKNQASKRLCAGLDKWVTPKKTQACENKRPAETTAPPADQVATPPKEVPPGKKVRAIENGAPKDTAPVAAQGKAVKAEVATPKVAAQEAGAARKDIKAAAEAVVEPAAGDGETVLGTGMLG